MSDRLPSLKADEVIRTLKKAGFEVTRIKGSHHGCATRRCQPGYGGARSRGLLRKIIADAGLTVDEFKTLL
jgi:predicted RNA binding protein YcfA (HicA-like mRNA interferase family)